MSLRELTPFHPELQRGAGLQSCRAGAQGMSIEGGGRFWKAMAECGARERGDIF